MTKTAQAQGKAILALMREKASGPDDGWKRDEAGRIVSNGCTCRSSGSGWITRDCPLHKGAPTDTQPQRRIA